MKCSCGTSLGLTESTFITILIKQKQPKHIRQQGKQAKLIKLEKTWFKQTKYKKAAEILKKSEEQQQQPVVFSSRTSHPIARAHTSAQQGGKTAQNAGLHWELARNEMFGIIKENQQHVQDQWTKAV